MKKVVIAALLAAFLLLSTGCSEEMPQNTTSETAETTAPDETAVSEKDARYICKMTETERASVVFGDLSPECEFYDEVADFADNIKQIMVYDEEIEDTFMIHISLPENYDAAKKYPLLLMTDGVWRLSDHPQLREYMKNGEIDELIVADVGYPNGYDYFEIRERDLINFPDKYVHFITENLTPYLCENYSIDLDVSMLTGHSYGGWWAFYELFNSDKVGKDMFKYYYIGSPSLQVSLDSKYIEDWYDEYMTRCDSLNCNVYVTVGGDEDFLFVSAIRKLCRTIQSDKVKGLDLYYEEIKDRGHNDVFKPSLHNALLRFYGN